VSSPAAIKNPNEKPATLQVCIELKQLTSTPSLSPNKILDAEKHHLLSQRSDFFLD
jgi:hypothetical protein